MTTEPYICPYLMILYLTDYSVKVEEIMYYLDNFHFIEVDELIINICIKVCRSTIELPIIFKILWIPVNHRFRRIVMASWGMLRWQRLRLMLSPPHSSVATTSTQWKIWHKILTKKFWTIFLGIALNILLSLFWRDNFSN